LSADKEKKRVIPGIRRQLHQGSSIDWGVAAHTLQIKKNNNTYEKGDSTFQIVVHKTETDRTEVNVEGDGQTWSGHLSPQTARKPVPGDRQIVRIDLHISIFLQNA